MLYKAHYEQVHGYDDNPDGKKKNESVEHINEAKFKEIECELFYKCLVYKNTALIKFIGKVDKATLINPEKFGFKDAVEELADAYNNSRKIN